MSDAEASRRSPAPLARSPFATTDLPVAVDAMGGDHAPAVVVEGGVLAAREAGQPVTLVGDRARIAAELSRLAVSPSLPVTVRHASEVVAMDEKGASALRRKKDASIRVCLDLVKSGEAAAAVSAGNSGAFMAIGSLVLGRIEGVDRAAIATLLPSRAGRTVLIDAGANVDCKPQHLVQFAIMGDIFARRVLGIAEPRVGLLTNGTEDAKGTDVTREALASLRAVRHMCFLGNVEGRDLYNGRADVVVCDGLLGNVALKTSEGLADAVRSMMREEIERRLLAKLGYLLIRPAFRAFERRVDYAEVGGAPLLGLDGVAIVSHGGSSARAIKNAVRVAATFAATEVNRHIHDGLARHEDLAALRARPVVEAT